jgi:hypothetical protein
MIRRLPIVMLAAIAGVIIGHLFAQTVIHGTEAVAPVKERPIVESNVILRALAEHYNVAELPRRLVLVSDRPGSHEGHNAWVFEYEDRKTNAHVCVYVWSGGYGERTIASARENVNAELGACTP